MESTVDSIVEESKNYNYFSASQGAGSSFYGVPNHFPLLSKGFSQWLPRQFKPSTTKSFQSPFFQPIMSPFHIPTSAPDTSTKPHATPKQLPNQNSPDFASSILPRQLKDKEKAKIKAKAMSLCNELEVIVRKIPSFQVSALPTPTRTRYEIMKAACPLRISIDCPEKDQLRTYTSGVKTRRYRKITVYPEVDKEKIKTYKEEAMVALYKGIRESNGVEICNTDVKSFKFFVGPGNNSGLIVRLMRNRNWWSQTEDIKEANFVWTSVKQQKLLRKLESGTGILLGQAPAKINRKFLKEPEKSGLNLILDSMKYCKLETVPINSASLKLCNRIEQNKHICSKKLLFSNLKSYFDSMQKDIFCIIPMTFHIKSIDDQNFAEFQSYYSSLPSTDSKNIWIIKPGENTNRGKGISIANSLPDIKSLVSSKISKHTCIIQKYIEKPLLINKRKFDIRCFAVMTSINSNIQGYFYNEGYIRTSSKEFSTKNLDSKFVHLTNDAVQKNSEDYGKFEPGNKMSYTELQNYINTAYPNSKISVEKDIVEKIKEIVTYSFEAVVKKIDPYKRLHCFELFGYDFMVDEDFKVWLIEANTNPCLETSCAFLARVIPSCVENTLKIVLDPLFPQPADSKKASDDIVNKFELVFNEFKYKNT